MVDGPEIILKDTILCPGTQIQVRLEIAGEVVWEDGTRSNEYSINKPGTYHFHLDDGRCITNDSIVVHEGNCPEVCKIYAPNVFTPDGDMQNDEFGVFSGCNFNEYKLQIYDRWGSLVFKTVNPTEGWK